MVKEGRAVAEEANEEETTQIAMQTLWGWIKRYGNRGLCMWIG